MKTDVMLVTAPSIETSIESIPIGLAYIKAYLSNAGISSKIIDLYRSRTGYEEALDILEEYEYPIIGVSAIELRLEDVIEFCRLHKQYRPEIKIVVGGYAGFCYEELLKTGNVDVVVVGEGEHTMIELSQALLSDKNIEQIKGIAYKDREIVFTGRRSPIDDLDSMLFPDISETPPVKLSENIRVLNIFSSRGCFNSGCAYCLGTLMHPKYRVMGAERIADFIEHAKTIYPDINTIDFVDDSFDMGRLPEIMEELRARNIDISYFILQTTTKNITARKKLLPYIAPFILISLGIESFDDEQLKEWNKRISAEENWEAVELCNEHNIDFTSNMMVDMTHERLEHTLEKVREPEFWTHPVHYNPVYISPCCNLDRSRHETGSYANIDSYPIPEINKKLMKRNMQRFIPWQFAFAESVNPFFGFLKSLDIKNREVRKTMQGILNAYLEKCLELSHRVCSGKIEVYSPEYSLEIREMFEWVQRRMH